MTNKEPFHIYTCGMGVFLGTANEDGAKLVRDNGGTVVDTRLKPFPRRNYVRLSHEDGGTNLSILGPYLTSDGSNGLRFATTEGDEPWCGLNKQQALNLASDIQEYYEEDEFPEWVDRDKTYEHEGDRYRPSEYRPTRQGDVFVSGSSPNSDGRAQDHALRHESHEPPGSYGPDPRIILEPVVDWPEWVNQDRVYHLHGRRHKPSEYRLLGEADEHFVCFSDPHRMNQESAAVGNRNSLYGQRDQPRIILKPVED